MATMRRFLDWFLVAFLVRTTMGLSPLPEGESPQLPACKTMTLSMIPKYHLDDQCDRATHNSYQKRLLRASRHESLVPTGVAHIPNQQTVVCPMQPQTLEMFHGHDTKWIVENKSSGPVVVAVYWEGIEYSAVHSDIYPPQRDPHAILQPGEWRAIDTFEGHVFHVREVKSDGQLGNILLQHRPGLVGFSNRFGHELNCNDLVEDLEPLVEVEEVVEDNEVVVVVKTDPEYSRSPNHRDERCHIVYQGFRNMLPNCPLNVYYIGMQEPPAGDEKTCQETFKLHLGIDDTPDEYMFDWESRTKFEGILTGHTFVARLAHPRDSKEAAMVVDSFTLKPTEIYDCPDSSQEETVSVSSVAVDIQAAIVQPLDSSRLWNPFGMTNQTAASESLAARLGNSGNQTTTRLLLKTSSI